MHREGGQREVHEHIYEWSIGRYSYVSPLIFLSTDQDGSEPSPNSTSASNLHRLSCYLDKKLHPSATHVYATFREMLSKAPVALCGMLESFLWHQQTPKQVCLVLVQNACWISQLASHSYSPLLLSSLHTFPLSLPLTYSQSLV